MARTVVPCRMSIGAALPADDAPGSSCGATRRNRSTKEGPGSSPGPNDGIGDSVTRASLYGRPPQPPRPLTDHVKDQQAVDERRDISRHVLDREREQVGIVVELAQRVVAPDAQQSADPAGRVVVVHVQRDLPWWLAADRT